MIYCSECGIEISRESKDIPMIPHTPAEAVRENEFAPTCDKAGSYEEVIYCSECGIEISRESKDIPMIPHTPAEAVRENEVAPTCDKAGSYEEVIYCSECGIEISRESKTVPATEAHEDNNHNHRCDACGKQLTECIDENNDRKCDICGKILRRTIDDAVSVFAIDDICEADLIKWHSAVIVIGDTVSLRIKFRLPAKEDMDGNIIRADFADGTVCVFTQDDLVLGEDGFFYVEIKDIPASRFDTEFTIAMYADEQLASDILHYSVASYVYAMKDNDRTGPRVKEMYEDPQS